MASNLALFLFATFGWAMVERGGWWSRGVERRCCVDWGELCGVAVGGEWPWCVGDRPDGGVGCLGRWNEVEGDGMRKELLVLDLGRLWCWRAPPKTIGIGMLLR
eukprot:scaffold507203_cov15-Prasinocladus_malaysianus.AAC.1